MSRNVSLEFLKTTNTNTFKKVIEIHHLVMNSIEKH